MGESKRPGVTRATMIEAALRLLDEVGLDGLTVRRLAGELGVQSPALYWHIRTKQELLDGMAEAIVVAARMGPPRAGESWEDWLSRRAHAYRASLLAHRDGARVVAGARQVSPAAIRRVNEELTTLVGHGFTPVLGLRTVAAVTHYVNGFVLREQTAEPTTQLSALTELLDNDADAPLLRAVREGGTTTDRRAFDHGLRAVITGAAALLRAAQAES
ncbi:TetR family transcriptional regulator [Nocardia tenerifensis]|uniref:TetR family transcriptional regulator n=1 Tax=Nocardia tenerifensis TaxID=228006 RepID=A0A318K061_9NOCA|nr:TetR/AcrR family transcriptional regulator C-terminal domain-containing protein [Nocardia tenerifensis]PXX61657.1 TetR family transcriptional regulator [Nocardia tenerifensis]